MSYSFQAGEAIPDGMRRIVQQEIDRAIGELSGSGGEESIHEARKSIKRIRALLRLRRPTLGARYAGENRAFRDIGRALSPIRDAAALIGTTEALSKRYGAKELSPVRAAMVKIKHERERDSAPDVHSLVRRLNAARQRVNCWPAGTNAFPAIGEGLGRVYKSGKKAYATAIDDGSAESYHSWRKSAKYLMYHMKLMEPAAPSRLKKVERVLDELQEALGDDHNLAVLAQLADNDPQRFGGNATVKFLQGAISKEQRRLRKKAEARGSKIYSEKRSAFVEEIQQIWESWTRQGVPARKRPVRAGSRVSPAAKAG
jgi:CHAD domain-containing protein